MIWRVRRVVTGHDAEGRSTFIADGAAPNVKEIPALPGLALTDLRETGRAPASNAGDADGREGFKSIGAAHTQDRSSSDPMMHKTSTVDYIIVLKGEIHAVLETGEKLLRAGDVLVQRGTNHSWSVRGAEPCIVAAVLVSAKPLKKASRKKTRK